MERTNTDINKLNPCKSVLFRVFRVPYTVGLLEKDQHFHATWVRRGRVNNCYETSGKQLKAKRTRNTRTTRMNAEKYEVLSVFIRVVRVFCVPYAVGQLDKD
jgi:hypothetical protein